ncbi:rhodanese-like domain-containing protein [Glaciibacter psychrotolerans]|uniref:Rhodanese-related sulfurtransferase n=1 Tax=Glaciibacter psychrotolerans TaxID=670054 RepID=A0A7Z0EE05_9MICO|nr:rhodanese-like domain-containing protein [Leifsonia psychrotolerans]NYJ19932.1 rhodanese-related sulfurtransferase [Leifsonia psychrotolerans]
MQEITPTDLAALGEAATIIDVREDGEYAQVHVAGTTHIPMSEFVNRLAEVPREDTLYIMCAAGGRSAQVAAYLGQEGYDAVNVVGGISAWQAAGLPSVFGAETGR